MKADTLHATILNLDPEWASRTAVKTPKGSLDYAQLREYSLRLARWLADQGCQRGDRIAVCLPKSIDSVIAQLGSMMAGAAYVPVDPTAPAQRQATIIALAGAQRILTTPEIGAALRNTGMTLPPLTELTSVGLGEGIASLLQGVSAGVPDAQVPNSELPVAGQAANQQVQHVPLTGKRLEQLPDDVEVGLIGQAEQIGLARQHKVWLERLARFGERLAGNVQRRLHQAIQPVLVVAQAIQHR